MVRLTACIILALFSLQVYGEVNARLDRTTIAENETATLTITSSERGLNASPDIRRLENNFDILNTQQATRSQWINGQGSTTTEWRYTLAPRAAGVITIPAIAIGNHQTRPLTLQVKPAKQQQSSQTDPIFIKVHTDKKSVHVQEQLLLTVQINYAIQVSNLDLTPPEITGARVEQLDEARFERRLNNNNYITHEIVYAIYPQTSGTLKIPPIRITASIPRTQTDALLRRGETRRFNSKALEIPVKAAETAGPWLPASHIELSEKWSHDPGQLQVGDSITRTITTQAQGLMAEQLPDIVFKEQAGLNLYRDRPQLDTEKSSSGVIGKRTDSIAIVATKPGKITLPAITINWWNSKSGQMEQAQLPEVILNIKPASLPQAVESADTESPATPADPVQQPGPQTAGQDTLWLWQLATFINTALVIVLAWLLLARRSENSDKQEPTQATDKEQILRVLKKACAQRQSQAIARYLLQWARMQYPQLSVYAIADLARIHPDVELVKWLNTLDACLYNDEKDSEHDWLAFYHLLQQLSRSENSTRSASLYPTR